MLFLRDRLAHIVDWLTVLADLLTDWIKTAWARRRYPYSVPIHIVGIAEYSKHYEWVVANVEDYKYSVWTIMQKQYYHYNNGTAETHYVGEFRFKRKTDAVNYALCFN